MANGTELGKAYVQIVPSAQGISGQISGLLGGEVSSAGSAAGSALGGSLIGALSGVIAAAGIGKMVTDAITTGMDFDKAMSQVAATMGTTTDQIGELRDFAKEMGATTSFSAQQAAESLNFMALAGYDAETSMKMLPNVLNLAAAGGIELAQASDMVTDAQTALGLSLDETSIMVDQMAKASSKSNTSVQQLGDAFLTIGANARNARGGTTELSTVLGVLADNGIKGSEAGTHLRNIMLSMNPTTDKAAAAWEQLGVQAYDAEGNLRALPDIFGDLKTAMQGMTDEQKTNYFSAMFNKTDLASIKALVDTSSDRFQELNLAIQGAWYSADSLEEGLSGVGLSLSGMESDLSGLGISAEEVSTALDVSGGSAEEFISYLVDFSDTGATAEEVLKAMGTDLDSVQTAFDGVSGAAQAMADTQLDNLAGDITLAKSAFEGLQIAISEGISPMLREIVADAGTFMQDLSAAITSGDTNAIFNTIKDGISGAISGAIDMIVAGNNFLAEHADQIITMGLDLASSVGLGIIEGIPTLVQSAFECAVAFGNAIINYDWAALGSQLLTALQGLIPAESATNIMQPILDGITAALPGLLSTGVEIITNLATGILDSLPALIETAGTLVIQLADFILTNAPTILAAGVDLVVNLCTGIINALPQVLDVATKLILKAAETMISHLPQILSVGVMIPAKLTTGIFQALPKIVEAAMKIITNFATTIKNYNWLSLGKSMIDGIIKGLQSAGDALITAIVSMCKGAFDAVKKFFGISSPSKLMANEIGRYIPEGIALGIQENSDAVYDAMADLKTDALDAGALMDVGTSPTFSGSSDSNAVLARMDAMLSLMERYFPEMAENDGAVSISAINRQLGAAYS